MARSSILVPVRAEASFRALWAASVTLMCRMDLRFPFAVWLTRRLVVPCIFCRQFTILLLGDSLMRVQVVGCIERKGTSKAGNAYHFFAVSAVVSGPDGNAVVGEFTQDAPVKPGAYDADLVPSARDGRLVFSVAKLVPVLATPQSVSARA